MAKDGNDDVVRREMLRMLMGKVEEDAYPSATMLDMIESLLKPNEIPAYAELLMEKIRRDRVPSIPLMNRILELT